MILAFDIGNTHIVTGIYNENGKLLTNFRMATENNTTEDQLFSCIKNISDFNNINLKDVKDIIISSVVPNINVIFEYLCKKYFNITPIIVNLDLKLPFTFSKDLNSNGFGADRIINIVKAMDLYGNRNFVTFDFGTASTYEVLEKGVYIGGGILPGINMSINALFGNTAKLPKVEFQKPSSILGRDTVEQIQAGIFFGYVGQIREIIRRVKEILPDVLVIATGGLGENISMELSEIDVYLPNLATDGLFELYKMNRKI